MPAAESGADERDGVIVYLKSPAVIALIATICTKINHWYFKGRISIPSLL